VCQRHVALTQTTELLKIVSTCYEVPRKVAFFSPSLAILISVFHCKTVRSEFQMDEAITALKAATAILVIAGTQLGCDSGVPDCTNIEKWNERYSHLTELECSYNDVWSTNLFYTFPNYSWTFWWDVMSICRETDPGENFKALKEICDSKLSMDGYFVYTDSFDGLFERAGFAEGRLLEFRGNIHYVQQTEDCFELDCWKEDIILVQDEDFGNMVAGNLPLCKCENQKLIRPNVLHEDDGGWVSKRALEQYKNYKAWREDVAKNNGDLVVLAIGETSKGVRDFPLLRTPATELGAIMTTGATLIQIGTNATSIHIDTESKRSIELSKDIKGDLKTLLNGLSITKVSRTDFNPGGIPDQLQGDGGMSMPLA